MIARTFLLASALALMGAKAQIDTLLGPVYNTKLGPTPLNIYIPELLVDTGVARLYVADVGQSNCKRWTPGPVGQDGVNPVMVEDIVMHRPSKIAFMGSDPYRIHPNRTAGWMPGMAFLDADYGAQGNGAVFVYDYGNDVTGTGDVRFLTKLQIQPALQSFHPHGVKILPMDGGIIRLFVVNHRAQPPYNEDALYSVVEVLDYDPATPTVLTHRQTVSDPLIWTPNNVAPTGPTSFYVSNDHTHRSGVARTLEEYGQLPLSWITYCDFSSGTVQCLKAFDGLRGANGMNTDGQGTIFANEALGGDTIAFTPNADKTLYVSKRYNLDYVPDNVGYDPVSKTLTPTGHPKAFDFQFFAAGTAATAPSWVDVIKADGTTKRVWSDDGNLLSGSTVFEVDSTLNVALVSGVFDSRGVVRCNVPKGF
ncbi:uncharacterized protein SPPG_01584 [Spizellomyces punctatus DAOM BR117]|uniref:SMP-30/Gluconolactonase/LRE-like region domain-containing protein n=1 Tax=Spizellomyces punctatus (strain DAOM BR117) TaxID=645134 RepID=A0A0L0HTF7_SPIPD|nr:uncharacterized protein SPPG_01584 [Spizellomyces punctatus DAOM BR117]KND04149.1 hypothetical protein SPPG_01584 [Spizellomyces punctatus DAOM BR117]|eukprot:XP_016612188.1 hypothetical protein SPPG_01584 [Spizellomyces punctatus DAOM BR117]